MSISRQVSEAMRIHSSQDHLLNIKNEYSSNCLTNPSLRRREEKEENEEQRRIQTFKDIKRRPDDVTEDVRGWKINLQEDLSWT